MIEIKTQLTREVFVQEGIQLLNKTVAPKILNTFGFLCLIAAMYPLYKGLIFDFLVGIMCAAFGFLGLPALWYLLGNKAYDEHNRLKEITIYKINNEWVEQIGESFTSKIFWSKIDKIEESKFCFILYENKFQAHYIPKQDMTAEQITALQALLKTIPLQKK